VEGTSVRQNREVECPGNTAFRILGGAFSDPGANGEISLYAGRCRRCGKRSFPTRLRCVNCYGADIDIVPLSRVGNVLTFTIVRMAPAGYAGPVPYVVGQVRIGDDITVLAPLVGKAPEFWRAGDAVASYALTLRDGGQNSPAEVCFSFRPATEQDYR